MSEDLSCKIFVDTPKNLHWLRFLIASTWGVEEDFRMLVETPLMSLDLNNNEKYAVSDNKEGDDGFLNYPHSIDVDLQEGKLVDRAAYVAEVRKLIGVLKADGCRVVAACDFEDELR